MTNEDNLGMSSLPRANDLHVVVERIISGGVHAKSVQFFGFTKRNIHVSWIIVDIHVPKIWSISNECAIVDNWGASTRRIIV